MIWRKIHRWLSIPLGIFIFLICFSGALLSFERELSAAFAPDAAGKLPFFVVVRSLHRSLCIGTIGKLIVGYSTLALVVILISGLIMWCKRAHHNLRQSLSVVFPTPMRGMHVALGVYVMIILLLCALTGMTWSFGWFRDAVYFLFEGHTSDPLFHYISGLHTGRIGGMTLRILWFIAVLIGASLPITGYWIYISRRRRKK